MADTIVVNTGPLLALARGKCVHILERLPWVFISPREVQIELSAGEGEGLPPIETGCVTFLDLAGPIPSIVRASLDVGEAAVIQLAIERKADIVCIDERKGRRVALAAGLSVVGSLGLLGKAKELGVIPAVRPLVERMQAGGVWFHPDLVRQVLVGLGEDKAKLDVHPPKRPESPSEPPGWQVCGLRQTS